MVDLVPKWSDPTEGLWDDRVVHFGPRWFDYVDVLLDDRVDDFGFK